MNADTPEAWVERLLVASPASEADALVIFEVAVSDRPGLVYEVVLAADGFGFRRPSGVAVARLTTDLAGARGLHDGTTNAQALLAAGRLGVSGDIQALVDGAGALEQLSTQLAELTARIGPIP